MNHLHNGNNYNILRINQYCTRLFAVFAGVSIKGLRNKHLIHKVWRVLERVKLRHNLSIGWVKAQTVGSTPEALGNAARQTA